MSFDSETTHEVKSIALRKLLRSAENLQHLADTPIIMCNYRVASGWFGWGATSIEERLGDMEPCPHHETLGDHLRIPIGSCEASDALALSGIDYQAVMRAL